MVRCIDNNSLIRKLFSGAMNASIILLFTSIASTLAVDIHLWFRLAIILIPGISLVFVLSRILRILRQSKIVPADMQEQRKVISTKED